MSRLLLHLASVNEHDNRNKPRHYWGLIGAFAVSFLLWVLILHTLRIL